MSIPILLPFFKLNMFLLITQYNRNKYLKIRQIISKKKWLLLKITIYANTLKFFKDHVEEASGPHIACGLRVEDSRRRGSFSTLLQTS